jgi:predicted patatin/cPLA2 family phospholipase
MQDKNERSLVVYFSAGAMSGIFSAGFSKVLEEAGLKDKIHSVYGNSAGSMSALYFLSGQVDLGAALYYEDLDGTKYMRWDRLPSYVGWGFYNRFFGKIFGKKKNVKPVFNIDLIEKIITTKRKVNFENFKKSAIDCYMIAYNISLGHHDYLKLENEQDIVPYLRATGGGHPAYPHASHIHGNLYVDGGTIDDQRRIAKIVERHPDKEIICVLNNPKWVGKKYKNMINKIAIALVMFPFFGWREAWKTANSDFSNTDISLMKKDYPFLHFIGNDLPGYQMSTNPEHHKMLYKRGQELAKEFLLSGDLKTVKI